MKHLALAALGALTACRSPDTQTRPPVIQWPAPGSWITVQTPRCGEVLGRVVFWPFGGADTTPRPLANALVQIDDTSRAGLARQRSAGTATTTNTNGEFRLRLPDGHTSVLLIRSLGLAPVAVAIDGGQYRAVALDVGMRSTATHDPQYGTHVQVIRGFRNCTP